MNILIIDEGGEERDVFCTVLKQVLPQGNCIRFDVAEDALQHLEYSPTPPAYIFLDHEIDSMDGKDCFIQMKRMQHVRTAFMVVYSQTPIEEHARQLYEKLGAHILYIKDFSVSELLIAFTELIQPVKSF